MKNFKEILIKENCVKNLIVLITTFLLYPNLSEVLKVVSSDGVNDFLLMISIFLVTVCFANFAFTYEKTKIESIGSRMLAHSATFLFLLLTALLLEAMVIVVGITYPLLSGVAIVFSILLYLAIILYDTWDLLRVL